MALEAHLPPVDAILPRNRAITALYARWYLENPRRCKWAGMAAYASDNIRAFLTLSARTRGWPMPGAVRASFDRVGEQIRATNNAIFEDIGWAHAAYLSPDGGLAAVEEGLADRLDTHGELLAAFRRLDEADERAPDDTIAWDAAARMLKHEQHRIAQPQFDGFPRGLRLWLSLTSHGQFAPAARWSEPRGWFWLHGLRHGELLPDLGRVEARWRWLEEEVLPLWATLDPGPTGVLWPFLERCAAPAPGATATAPPTGA